jgi:hypothetical protein
MATITLSFAGKTPYVADWIENHHRLLVSIRCRIGDLSPPVWALLDTGAEWCVLRPDIATALGYDFTPDPVVPPLETRFGKLYGRLERIPIIFEAEEGEDLEVPATWFISEDWPGSVVIGWKGCLERMRFALDPSEDGFYFAKL